MKLWTNMSQYDRDRYMLYAIFIVIGIIAVLIFA